MTAEERQLIADILNRQERIEDPTPEDLRAVMALFTEFVPKPDDIEREDVDAGGVPAEYIAAPGADPTRVVLYLHGGGYNMGSSASHARLAYDLSQASGARPLLPNYRLAPEHPFPAAIEDAVAAYHWLLAGGTEPGKIVVAGDSAGGGLAMATLLSLRDECDPLPAAGLLISPWVDLEGLGESLRENQASDPVIHPDGVPLSAGWYLNGADPRDPLAAAIYADLSGLPPLLIQSGAAEILRDDSRRLAERAIKFGVEVRHDEWPDMFHVWQMFAHMLSEGRDAIAEAGAFIRGKIS